MYNDYTTRYIKRKAEFFRQQRINKGMSQKDMAKYCGCTQANISYFESGENNNMYILLRYIDALYGEECFPWLQDTH